LVVRPSSFVIRDSSSVIRPSPDKNGAQPTTNNQQQITNNQQQITNNPAWSLVTDMLSDRHARAKAFGVDSVLNLPFPAAVKTGTSSDYRDTWTVGFTRDYTVAVWVGNFDGSPMQRVSGVTGAAPLWQRIMLHLHEQQEPAAFAPPAGLLKRPICALTGEKPAPDCETVVQEYFFPEDLVAYEQVSGVRCQMSGKQVSGKQVSGDGCQVSGASPDTRNLKPNTALPAEYNEWLARQSQTRLAGDALRIMSPQNQGYFLVEPGQSVGDALEFKLATVPNQAVEWRLNGTVLATQATQSIFWRARPGRWVLEVRQGNSSDRITFEVEVGEREAPYRGFSYQ